MPKPSGVSAPAEVLFLSPEAPYPPIGGGALRSASLLAYFARRAPVDLILFSQPSAPDPAAALPSSFAARSLVLPLPPHGSHPAARLWRNALRAARSRPPLLDRFSGFEAPIADFVAGRHYKIAIIEHFWCAPYLSVLRPFADRVWLDLHNVESILATRHARHASPPAALGIRRFARAYESLERSLLPAFDLVLAPSSSDAAAVARLAPDSRTLVFPNTIPEHTGVARVEQNIIAFSGNLAYPPNADAVAYFSGEIWPLLRSQWPSLQFHVIGRNPGAVARFIRPAAYTFASGPVDDAVLELSRAQAVVVPLRMGSGTRVKILEAWAAGAPVVSTSLGAEGLGAIPGRHLLIADSPSDFAAAVSRLLASPALRAQIGLAGRAFYEQHFTWTAGWSLLDRALAGRPEPDPPG